MDDIRIQESGEIVSEQTFRRMHPTKSFSRIIPNEVLQMLGADRIVRMPPPFISELERCTSSVAFDVPSGRWKQVWTVEAIDVAAAKGLLKQRVTEKRWKVETGGLLFGGTPIATGVDDQNRISNVLVNAERAGVQNVKFKGVAGWVELPIAAITAIANAITLHVQACFSAECDHHLAIDAIEDIADGLTAIEQLIAYDVNVGWPANPTPLNFA